MEQDDRHAVHDESALRQLCSTIDGAEARDWSRSTFGRILALDPAEGKGEGADGSSYPNRLELR